MIAVNYELFIHLLFWAWGLFGVLTLISATAEVDEKKRIGSLILGIIMVAMILVCLVL